MPNPRARFLARVEELVPGRAERFAPPLDALVAWSLDHQLEYVSSVSDEPVVRFRVLGAANPLWSAIPQARVGAVLVLMDGAGFDAGERCRARAELAAIEGRPIDLSRPPELTFAKLAWAPYRSVVLALLGRQVGPLIAVSRADRPRPKSPAATGHTDSASTGRPVRV